MKKKENIGNSKCSVCFWFDIVCASKYELDGGENYCSAVHDKSLSYPENAYMSKYKLRKVETELIKSDKQYKLHTEMSGRLLLLVKGYKVIINVDDSINSSTNNR